ncbi:hypothetical protein TgHK011_003099 [Trichoderma gracile]|nr:hypothetical protein TgHK011_003099 [Trichoderma gracile]
MKPFRLGFLTVGVFFLHLALASFILTQNQQGTQIACCAQGNDPATSTCCDAKQHLPGTEKAGYRCCPLAQFAKGVVCGSLGKIMVDGECVCPSDMIEDADGLCQNITTEPSCKSGLHEGKCYLFKLSHGLFGPGMGGQYDIVDQGRKFGKFKLCKTEACSGKSAINPHDEFRIYDVHGDGTPQSSGLWMRWPPEGGIETTETWRKASKMAITRWADGKYCLSQVFDAFTNQQCFPMWVVEVPCDIRAPENNCLWGESCDGCNSARSKVDDEDVVTETPPESPDAGEMPHDSERPHAYPYPPEMWLTASHLGWKGRFLLWLLRLFGYNLDDPQLS